MKYKDMAKGYTAVNRIRQTKNNKLI